MEPKNEEQPSNNEQKTDNEKSEQPPNNIDKKPNGEEFVMPDKFEVEIHLADNQVSDSLGQNCYCGR